MNVVMLPMWLLSGVFFSSENFPAVMQPFIRALPLTALNEALRGQMIDGTGLASVACRNWPCWPSGAWCRSSWRCGSSAGGRAPARARRAPRPAVESARR